MSRRALVCLAMLAAIAPAAASCSSPPALASAKTVLHITYWPHGQDAGHARRWRLTCRPTGGTHPAARLACHEASIATQTNCVRPRDPACRPRCGERLPLRCAAASAATRSTERSTRGATRPSSIYPGFSPALLPPGGSIAGRRTDARPCPLVCSRRRLGISTVALGHDSAGKPKTATTSTTDTTEAAPTALGFCPAAKTTSSGGTPRRAGPAGCRPLPKISPAPASARWSSSGRSNGCWRPLRRPPDLGRQARRVRAHRSRCSRGT